MNNPKEETVESVNLNFGYFQVYIFLNVIFQISTLEFIKNEFLTNKVNFSIGSAFFKGQGSGAGLFFLEVQVRVWIHFIKYASCYVLPEAI